MAKVHAKRQVETTKKIVTYTEDEVDLLMIAIMLLTSGMNILLVVAMYLFRV